MITDRLFQCRFKLLKNEKSDSDDNTASLAGGRLLLFDPDASLFDGAAEAASKGFFDPDNIPARDTWVYYDIDEGSSYEQPFHTFLVSWVPETFVNLVQGGVDVNPESCIRWTTEIKMAFTIGLRKEGLLKPKGRWLSRFW